MKKIKMNRALRIVLGCFAAVLLFILGAHGQDHAGGAALATGAATVVLSQEEKDAIPDENAQKVVLAIKKAMTIQMEEFKRGTIDNTALTARLDSLKQGLTDTELKALKDLLETQGNSITELRGKLNQAPTPVKTALQVFKDEIDESKDELAEIRKNRSGTKAFSIQGFGIGSTKAAAVTMTIDPGAGDTSIAEQGSAAALLRLGDGPIYEIARGVPFILNFVNVGQTNSAALIWFDEVANEGAFAVTAEGAAKPLLQYKFERRTAEYRKVAGYTVITDEFTNDFPRLVSTINRLMKIDVRNKMNALILADMVTSASAYSYSGLDDQVDNADDYAAIGAAIAQLQNNFYTPNVLVLNPADAWRMRLTKSTGDGQYLMPPFSWNGTTYEFGRVIVDPAVTAGNFFVGDGNVYNVDLKGDIIVRVGFNSDDFIKNQYSMVVEQYFYNYISNARKSGLIYGNFATIKAAIEKP